MANRGNEILRSTIGVGTTFAHILDRFVAEHTNRVLETIAKEVESMDPYDGYDGATLDSVAQLIRASMLEILPEEKPDDV